MSNSRQKFFKEIHANFEQKTLDERWPTIAQHGPFVVNTRQELKQAVDD